MEAIKEFILKNWYYIAAIILLIISLVLTYISVKKKGKIDTLSALKEAALEELPMWITLSEGLASGADKKANVLSLAIAFFAKKLGRNLTSNETDLFVAFIGDQLEKILSTPQKKLTKIIDPKKGYKIGG